MSVTIATHTLTEFSDKENSRTYIAGPHTAMKPQLVIQKRKVPVASDASSVQQSSLKVVLGTVDAAGLAMSQKISFEAIIRYPIGALAADIAAAELLFTDIVASTNFASFVDTQEYLG